MITGQQLVDFVAEERDNGIPKKLTVLRAGYVRENGKPAYTQFYTELALAKGLIKKVSLITQTYTTTFTFNGDASLQSIMIRCKKYLGLSGERHIKITIGNETMVKCGGETFKIVVH